MSRMREPGSVLVRALAAVGVLSDADVYLTAAMRRCSGMDRAALPGAVELALALVSRAIRDSHVCLDLDAVRPGTPGTWPPPEEVVALLPDSGKAFAACVQALADPARRAELFAAFPDLVGAPEPDAETPYVLDGARLYLRRYWDYECRVAERLLVWTRQDQSGASERDERALEIPDGLKPEQVRAAAMALTRRFCVISGGPGTGKTFTAARILALLSQPSDAGGPPLRIRVAAPTGKAAGRVQESLDAARATLPLSLQPLLADIEPACTIERLLGYRHGSPYFRHDADHPLPADVVLLDEASMIDLPKMAKLLDAMPPEARLILLGDMHQLASVQPGSVLGEICRSEALRSGVIELKDSRRFGRDTPIGHLSAAVNVADMPTAVDAAWQALDRPAGAEAGAGLVRHDVPPALVDGRGAVDRGVADCVSEGYREYLAARTPMAAFAALAKFRVLCALRWGPFGMVTVNRLIENVLSRPPTPDGVSLYPETEFYDHRPIMIVRNDYGLNLFNGDVGVVLPDPENAGRPTAFFHGRCGAGGDAEEFRKISIRLLPEHETAFAMTVHKAQGSEFEWALLILPREDSRVLTRETVYTGLTRVTRRIDVWADEAVFRTAVHRTVRRFSGLGDRLTT